MSSYFSCILNWLVFFFAFVNIPYSTDIYVECFQYSIWNGFGMSTSKRIPTGNQQYLYMEIYYRVEEIGERDNEPRTMNEFLNFHHVRWQKTKQRSCSDGLATIGLMKWTSAFFSLCGWWCGVYLSPSFLWWELYSFIQKVHSDAGKPTFDK